MADENNKAEAKAIKSIKAGDTVRLNQCKHGPCEAKVTKVGKDGLIDLVYTDRHKVEHVITSAPFDVNRTASDSWSFPD